MSFYFFLVSPSWAFLLSTVKRSLSFLFFSPSFSSQNNFNFRQLPSSFMHSKLLSLSPQWKANEKESEKKGAGVNENERTISLRRALRSRLNTSFLLLHTCFEKRRRRKYRKRERDRRRKQRKKNELTIVHQKTKSIRKYNRQQNNSSTRQTHDNTHSSIDLTILFKWWPNTIHCVLVSFNVKVRFCTVFFYLFIFSLSSIDLTLKSYTQ